MGTAKRERQKANRQLKYEQLAKQSTRQKHRRRGLQFGIIIPLLIAIVSLILILANRGGDDSTDVSDTTPDLDTTLPGDTTVPEVTGTEAPTTTIAAPPCPKEDGSSTRTTEFAREPDTCIDLGKVYLAEFETNKGKFTMELDPGIAPKTVNNFVFLARYHFFDSINCHRIIPGFVVQCGDPTGSGSGGPGYSLPDELPAAGAYQLGSVAMARGISTSGSQFFIVTGDQGVSLGPNYSLFGKVTAGFDDTVKAMEAAGTPGGTPSEPITIQKVTITVKEGAVPSTTTTAAPTTVAADSTTTTG